MLAMENKVQSSKVFFGNSVVVVVLEILHDSFLVVMGILSVKYVFFNKYLYVS